MLEIKELSTEARRGKNAICNKGNAFFDYLLVCLFRDVNCFIANGLNPGISVVRIV